MKPTTRDAHFCEQRLRYNKEESHEGEKMTQDMGAGANVPEKAISALKAIRAKCLECSCGSAPEVRNCELKICPLHRFRSGKNPNIKRVLTAEQRQTVTEHLAKIREARATA